MSLRVGVFLDGDVELEIRMWVVIYVSTKVDVLLLVKIREQVIVLSFFDVSLCGGGNERF